MSYDGIDETPHWSPDGKTLYFARRGTMYAVDVETDPEFRAGARRAVFDWPFPESRPDWDNISMLPSGKFVMIEPAAWEREPARFNVVLNFDEVVREALEGSD